jgi:hypothetical protein
VRPAPDGGGSGVCLVTAFGPAQPSQDLIETQDDRMTARFPLSHTGLLQICPPNIYDNAIKAINGQMRSKTGKSLRGFFSHPRRDLPSRII